MSISPAPGAVFDCNVFAQALINPRGPVASCLLAAQEGKVRLYVSDFVIQEIWELPSKLPNRFGITVYGVEAFLQNLGSLAFPVRSAPTIFSYERDKDDAAYVNLVLAASAQYLVTRDSDLLSLMDTMTAAGADFVLRFPDVQIVDPVTFLQAIK